MASTTQGRHVPVNNNAEGWPAAIITTLAALALWCGAWYIHKTTYRHPMDPMFRAKGALEHGNSNMVKKPAGAATTPAAGGAAH
ncbi:MAG: hypothetical protein MUF40_04110 [Gemmatimonadaceae bacterium]|jgi:hypothetical protein|nr:hypothetical protein [Gemmatimonadaceae bacterium]